MKNAFHGFVFITALCLLPAIPASRAATETAGLPAQVQTNPGAMPHRLGAAISHRLDSLRVAWRLSGVQVQDIRAMTNDAWRQLVSIRDSVTFSSAQKEAMALAIKNAWKNKLNAMLIADVRVNSNDAGPGWPWELSSSAPSVQCFSNPNAIPNAAGVNCAPAVCRGSDCARPR